MKKFAKPIDKRNELVYNVIKAKQNKLFRRLFAMKIEETFDKMLGYGGFEEELGCDAVDAVREAFRERLGWRDGSKEDEALVEYTNEVHKHAFAAGVRFKDPVDMGDVWAEASTTLDDVQGRLACCIAIAEALYENLEEVHSGNTNLAAALLNDLNRLAKDTGLKHDALCLAASWKKNEAEK